MWQLIRLIYSTLGKTSCCLWRSRNEMTTQHWIDIRYTIDGRLHSGWQSLSHPEGKNLGPWCPWRGKSFYCNHLTFAHRCFIHEPSVLVSGIITVESVWSWRVSIGGKRYILANLFSPQAFPSLQTTSSPLKRVYRRVALDSSRNKSQRCR